MGLFKSLRMAREADRLREEFLESYDSPSAYRPDVNTDRFGGRPPASADAVLQSLADFGRQYGLTAGDASILANILMDAVDEHCSFKEGTQEVLSLFSEGHVDSVSGKPMSAFVSTGAVVEFCRAVGVATRPEALAELLRIRELQEEYASLAATPAPLLEEARRMSEIRDELERLDAEPDHDLNDEWKRRKGVPDTPFNS